MGLASSQARLLSLTSRQHAVEVSAQRLLSEKLRLSNQSDAAYQKYMDALEDTALKTRQTDSNGDTFWIDGNINNLMRYGASDDTAGSVFYVQDMESGKLYVPQEVFDKYSDLTAATVPTGHDYTDAMKFATMFGVGYEKVDNNESIKINYEVALSRGWNNLLTDEQLDEYSSNAYKDDTVRSTANIILGMLPELDTETNTYKVPEPKTSIATSYESFVNQILGSFQRDSYEAKDIQLLQESLQLIKSITSNAPKSVVKTDTLGESTVNDGDIERIIEAGDYTYIVDYNTTKLSASKGDNEYMVIEDGSDDFTGTQKFELMLNGGTIKWEGTENKTYSNWWANYGYGHKNQAVEDVDTNIYTSNTQNILAQHGVSTMGEALTNLFTKISKSENQAESYLKSIGKTKDDVANYKKFKQLELDYSIYEPDYEYIPDNKATAEYYENVFNAIKAAGGCIGVNESTSKNAGWVENMIKNVKVILTTWDANEETLSKTSPSLHVDVKEISDDRRVAEAEQEYETELEYINTKDTNYDTILSKLETERSSITTEIDGIKKVMQDNVSVNFKVFS